MSAHGWRQLYKFTILLLISCSGLQAQSLIWSKHYGGYFNEGGYSCLPTDDGGYVAIGSTYSFGSGDHDMYILRLDSLGDTLWSRTVGGSLTEFGRDVQCTSDGGFLAVGSTTSMGAGKEDLYLVKVNAYGDFVWHKTFGGAQSDEGWSIRRTSDSSFIICGTTNSSGAGYADLWLLKIDATGSTIWSKTFGGAGGESGYGVRESYDGYIAVGATGSFGEGYSSIYAVKVAHNGDSLWANAYGGPKSDFGYSVEVAADGNYLLVGATASYGLGYYDAYVISVTPDGLVDWEKTYGGTRDDRGYAICNSADGGYLLTGTTESFGAGGSDMYVLKLNPVGDLEWSSTQGGSQSDYCRSVTNDKRGHYVLAGYSYSYATGGSDLYIITIVGDQSTPVEEIPSHDLPDGFALAQNFPNPFNAETRIQYTLPKRSHVSVTVYNLLGQQVKRWDDMSQSTGTYQITWDGRGDDGATLASGVYFYRLETGDFSDTKKMVLLK